MSRPRALTVLGIFTLLVGGLGASHALSTQLLPFAEHHDTYVNRVRDALDARQLPGVPGDERVRLGEQLGEKQWSRRGVTIPLGLVNLVLSFLLFAGALEAMRGRAWGQGAWEWACRVSVPYTVVATALLVVEMRDLRVPMAASLEAMSQGTGVSGAAFAAVGVIVYEALAVAWGLLLVGFYVTCAIYLTRPSVKALFAPPPAR